MLVCGGCMGRAIRIVPPADVAFVRCSCGEVGTVCGRCADKRAARPGDMQKQIAKKLRALAKAYANNNIARPVDSAHADGLEQAADIVEGWGRDPASKIRAQASDA